jgi:hypothetical protein
MTDLQEEFNYKVTDELKENEGSLSSKDSNYNPQHENTYTTNEETKVVLLSNAELDWLRKEEKKAKRRKTRTFPKHKSLVNFRHKASNMRRNCDKMIVRAILNHYQQAIDKITNIFLELNLIGYLDGTIKAIDSMNELDKQGGIAKNYAEVINNLLNTIGFIIVFKCCLEDHLVKYEESMPRIKQENKIVYKETIEDYLLYANARIERFMREQENL